MLGFRVPTTCRGKGSKRWGKGSIEQKVGQREQRPQIPGVKGQSGSMSPPPAWAKGPNGSKGLQKEQRRQGGFRVATLCCGHQLQRWRGGKGAKAFLYYVLGFPPPAGGKGEGREQRGWTGSKGRQREWRVFYTRGSKGGREQRRSKQVAWIVFFKDSGPFCWFRAFFGIWGLFGDLGPFRGFGAFSGIPGLFQGFAVFSGIHGLFADSRPTRGAKRANEPPGETFATWYFQKWFSFVRMLLHGFLTQNLRTANDSKPLKTSFMIL